MTFKLLENNYKLVRCGLNMALFFETTLLLFLCCCLVCCFSIFAVFNGEVDVFNQVLAPKGFCFFNTVV